MSAHLKELHTRLDVAVRPDGIARWMGDVLSKLGWVIVAGVAPHPIQAGYWVRAILHGGAGRVIELCPFAAAEPSGTTRLVLMAQVETPTHKPIPWDAETESAFFASAQQLDAGLADVAHVPTGWSLVKGYWGDPVVAARFKTLLQRGSTAV